MDPANLILLHTTPPESQNLEDSVERINPFEAASLQNYRYPLWSPSVFDNVSITAETPPQEDWTIHQKATLFPMPIEESPSSHMNPYVVDAETEAKAQADINMFFSRTGIAPSPQPKVKKAVLLFSRIDTSRSCKLTSAVSTMTNLSLPMILPPALEEALAPYFMTDVISSKIEADLGVDENQNRHPGLPFQQDEVPTISLASVRRRLELSFGDTPTDGNGINCTPLMEDPFGQNHSMMSPSTNTHVFGSLSPQQSSTWELEEQFKRCEFTPRGEISMNSPALTPITDDPTTSIAKSGPAAYNSFPLSPWNYCRREEIQVESGLTYTSTPTGQLKSTVYRNGFRRRKQTTSVSFENIDPADVENSSGTTHRRNHRRCHSTPSEMDSPPAHKISRQADEEDDQYMHECD